MFVDELKIFARSGHGGNGCVSFRREKYIPRGGPDGGDGGRGGHILVEVKPGLETLMPLRSLRHYSAENGQHGKGSNMTGAYGDDLILYVPKGTLIRRADNHLLVADLTEDHQQVVLLEGGQGGKGNTRFRSSSNQAPREAQPGTPGEEGWFIFELKVMADIGLVGFPNAGKSTLIATVSEAKPKIADYPFTTLNPHLGVVPIGRWNSLVMADIPGLIEGAGQGAGLGFRFLKHIERTAALLFLIDASDPEAKPMARYQTLLNELGTYNPTLLEKQRCVALTKKDLVLETDSDTHQAIRECQEQLTEQHIPVFFISAFERPTLLPLLETLYDITRSVRSQRTQEEAEEPSPFPHTRCTGSDDPLDWLTLPQDP